MEHELKTLLVIVTGVLLYVLGGWWLNWDYHNAFINWVAALDWPTFCQHWKFQLPGLLYTWDCWGWSVPFDISIALGLSGFVLFGIGCYMLGHYTE